MNDHAQLAQKFIEGFEVVAVNLEFLEDLQDKGLWETPIPNGYLQFGTDPDMDYDPVCFDISSRKNRDYRIVKIDHEDILCNSRSKVVAEIAAERLTVSRAPEQQLKEQAPIFGSRN